LSLKMSNIQGILLDMTLTDPQTKPARARQARATAATPPGVSEDTAMFLAADVDGGLQLDQVLEWLDISRAQLADSTGLGRDSLSKTNRRAAPKTRARIAEMLEIIARIEAWAGGRRQALAWYRAQPIAALDGRTAEALVKSGKAGVVRDYLDHIALGGFA
jgi:uncharacterized protein (DUF2384 family)